MITRAKISAVRASKVQPLFEGGTYYQFCPRCGAYSRAALIRVNMVLQSGSKNPNALNYLIQIEFFMNLYFFGVKKKIPSMGSCLSLCQNAGFSVIDFKSYHIEQNVGVMFKFVNVNKLMHKETLKSVAISSQTVFSKLHRKARTDKQVIRLKQIINSGETTEWLSYSYGKIIRQNLNQTNGNIKSAEITHCSVTCRVAKK